LFSDFIMLLSTQAITLSTLSQSCSCCSCSSVFTILNLYILDNHCLLISLFDLIPFTLRCFHSSTSIWYHLFLLLFFFYLGLLIFLWHFLLFHLLLHLVHHGSRSMYFMIIVVIFIRNFYYSVHLPLGSP
jgi:hypothetical protein